MDALVVAVLFAASPAALLAQRGRAAPPLPLVELRPGLEITSSARIVPRTYRMLAHFSMDSALIVVRGDDVTVDFTGAVLEGAPPEADPDRARGIAIRIDGGRNVRIRHATIRGFHIAVRARGTRNLEVSDSDLSYNWKPRLFSLIEHESLLDWLSFHQNEKGEWLRFGAALFLEDVKGGIIRGNRAVQGMNALLMARTDSLVIRDNEFAFNSGLGIGMYRSSDNTIVRNRLDYNVRGYSHGFYRRGQDSADLLMYQQSHRNVVAFNSATHGGDGLFIWAGQATMDTGEGGVNDNLFFGNDFSFAPTNAMEATFSRNAFVANRAEGSEYGLWGGYSFETKVIANCFSGNRWGIAIEHGQDNVIAANRFVGDSTAIRLWGDSIQPSDWGYPKFRDTRSRDYRISGNRFAGNKARVAAANTKGLSVTDNDSSGGPVPGCDRMPVVPPEFLRWVPGLPGIVRSVPASPEARRPRSAIVVDEWGPFDWRSPKLWPVDSTRAVPLRLAVLGPAGTWRVVRRRGVASISAVSGRVGDTIAVTPHPDSSGDWEVGLQYRGVATVSPRGARAPAGVPVEFSWSAFAPTMTWRARFHAWSDTTFRPQDDAAFAGLLRSTPTLARDLPRLDFMWYRPLIRELPLARWAMEATSEVTLADSGSYTLRVISDDAARVWVDGRLVVDNWKAHGSEINYARLDGGRHALRVQYYQADGWTEFRLDILRGESRSAGSPGPH